MWSCFLTYIHIDEMWASLLMTINTVVVAFNTPVATLFAHDTVIYHCDAFKFGFQKAVSVC